MASKYQVEEENDEELMLLIASKKFENELNNVDILNSGIINFILFFSIYLFPL